MNYQIINNISLWTRAHEFKGIFVVEFFCVSKILHKYSLPHHWNIFVTWKNILPYGIYTYVCIIFIDQGFSNLVMDTYGDGCKVLI
jgi:hypothetical protein